MAASKVIDFVKYKEQKRRLGSGIGSSSVVITLDTAVPSVDILASVSNDGTKVTFNFDFISNDSYEFKTWGPYDTSISGINHDLCGVTESQAPWVLNREFIDYSIDTSIPAVTGHVFDFKVRDDVYNETYLRVSDSTEGTHSVDVSDLCYGKDRYVILTIGEEQDPAIEFADNGIVAFDKFIANMGLADPDSNRPNYLFGKEKVVCGDNSVLLVPVEKIYTYNVGGYIYFPLIDPESKVKEDGYKESLFVEFASSLEYLMESVIAEDAGCSEETGELLIPAFDRSAYFVSVWADADIYSFDVGTVAGSLVTNVLADDYAELYSSLVLSPYSKEQGTHHILIPYYYPTALDYVTSREELYFILATKAEYQIDERQLTYLLFVENGDIPDPNWGFEVNSTEFITFSEELSAGLVAEDEFIFTEDIAIGMVGTDKAGEVLRVWADADIYTFDEGFLKFGSAITIPVDHLQEIYEDVVFNIGKKDAAISKDLVAEMAYTYIDFEFGKDRSVTTIPAEGFYNLLEDTYLSIALEDVGIYPIPSWEFSVESAEESVATEAMAGSILLEESVQVIEDEVTGFALTDKAEELLRVWADADIYTHEFVDSISKSAFILPVESLHRAYGYSLLDLALYEHVEEPWVNRYFEVQLFDDTTTKDSLAVSILTDDALFVQENSPILGMFGKDKLISRELIVGFNRMFYDPGYSHDTITFTIPVTEQSEIVNELPVISIANVDAGTLIDKKQYIDSDLLQKEHSSVVEFGEIGLAQEDLFISDEQAVMLILGTDVSVSWYYYKIQEEIPEPVIVYIFDFDEGEGHDKAQSIECLGYDFGIGYVVPILSLFSTIKLKLKDHIILEKEYYDLISITETGLVSIPVVEEISSDFAACISLFSNDAATEKDAIKELYKELFDLGTGADPSVAIHVTAEQSGISIESMINSPMGEDEGFGKDLVTNFYRDFFEWGYGKDTEQIQILIEEFSSTYEAAVEEIALEDFGFHYTQIKMLWLITQYEFLEGQEHLVMSFDGRDHAELIENAVLTACVFDVGLGIEGQADVLQMHKVKDENVGFDNIVIGIDREEFSVSAEDAVIALFGFDQAMAWHWYDIYIEVPYIYIDVSDWAFGCENTIIYDPTIAQRELMFWWEEGYAPGQTRTYEPNPDYGKPMRPGDADYPYAQDDPRYGTIIEMMIPEEQVKESFIGEVTPEVGLCVKTSESTGTYANYREDKTHNQNVIFFEDLVIDNFTILEKLELSDMNTHIYYGPSWFDTYYGFMGSTGYKLYLYVDFELPNGTIVTPAMGVADPETDRTNYDAQLSYVQFDVRYYYNDASRNFGEMLELLFNTNVASRYPYTIGECKITVWGRFKISINPSMRYTEAPESVPYTITPFEAELYYYRTIPAHKNPEYTRKAQIDTTPNDGWFVTTDVLYYEPIKFKLYINQECGVQPTFAWKPKNDLELFVADKLTKVQHMDIEQTFVGDHADEYSYAVETLAENDFAELKTHTNIDKYFKVWDFGYDCANTIVVDPEVLQRDLIYWFEFDYANWGGGVYPDQDPDGEHFTINPDFGKPITKVDMDYPYFSKDPDYGKEIYLGDTQSDTVYMDLTGTDAVHNWTTASVPLFSDVTNYQVISLDKITVISKERHTNHSRITWSLNFWIQLLVTGTNRMITFFTKHHTVRTWTEDGYTYREIELTPVEYLNDPVEMPQNFYKENDAQVYVPTDYAGNYYRGLPGHNTMETGWDLTNSTFSCRILSMAYCETFTQPPSYVTYWDPVDATVSVTVEWRILEEKYFTTRHQVFYGSSSGGGGAGQTDDGWFVPRDILYYDPVVFKLYVNMGCGTWQTMEREPENKFEKFLYNKLTKYEHLNIIAPFVGDHAVISEDPVIYLYHTVRVHGEDHGQIERDLFFYDYGYTCEDLVVYSRKDLPDRDIMFWWEKDYNVGRHATVDFRDMVPNPLLGSDIQPRDFDYPYSETSDNYGEVIKAERVALPVYQFDGLNVEHDSTEQDYTVYNYFMPLAELTDGMKVDISGRLRVSIGKVELYLVVISSHTSLPEVYTFDPAISDIYPLQKYTVGELCTVEAPFRGQPDGEVDFEYIRKEVKYNDLKFTIRSQDAYSAYGNVVVPTGDMQEFYAYKYVGVLAVVTQATIRDLFSSDDHISGYKFEMDFGGGVEKYIDEYLAVRAEGLYPNDFEFITRDFYNDYFNAKVYANLGCGRDLDAFPIDFVDDFERWVFLKARREGYVNRDYLFDGDLGHKDENVVIALGLTDPIEVEINAFVNVFLPLFEYGTFDYHAELFLITEDSGQIIYDGVTVQFDLYEYANYDLKVWVDAWIHLKEKATFTYSDLLSIPLEDRAFTTLETPVIGLFGTLELLGIEKSRLDQYVTLFDFTISKETDLFAVPTSDGFIYSDDTVITIASEYVGKVDEDIKFIYFIYAYEYGDVDTLPVVGDVVDFESPFRNDVVIDLAENYIGKVKERVKPDRNEIYHEVGYVCFWVQEVRYPFVIDWLAGHFVDYYLDKMEAEYYRFTSCFGIPPGGWPGVTNYPDPSILPDPRIPHMVIDPDDPEGGYRWKDPQPSHIEPGKGGYMVIPGPGGGTIYIPNPADPPGGFTWDGGTSIFITKSICDLDMANYLTVVDAFYFALFDEFGERVSDVQVMTLKNSQMPDGSRVIGSTYGAMIFRDVEPGQTYYVRETDEEGNILKISTESEFSGNKYILPQDGIEVTTQEDGQCVYAGDFSNLVESYGDPHGKRPIPVNTDDYNPWIYPDDNGGGAGGGKDYPHGQDPFRIPGHGGGHHGVDPSEIEEGSFDPRPWEPYVDGEFYPPVIPPIYPPPTIPPEIDVPGYEGRLETDFEYSYVTEDLSINIPVEMLGVIFELHYIPTEVILDLSGMKIEFIDGFDFEIDEPFRFDFDGFDFEFEEPFRFDTTEFTVELEKGFLFDEVPFEISLYEEPIKIDEVNFMFELMFEDVVFDLVDEDFEQTEAFPEVTASILTYSGADMALVTERGPRGTVLYKVDDGDWEKEVPRRKDAGVYKVYWYATESILYYSYGSKDAPYEVDCVINKAEPEILIDEVKCKYNTPEVVQFEYIGDGPINVTSADESICVCTVVRTLGGSVDDDDHHRVNIRLHGVKQGKVNLIAKALPGFNFLPAEMVIQCIVEPGDIICKAEPVVMDYTGLPSYGNISVTGPTEYTIYYSDQSLIGYFGRRRDSVDFYLNVGAYTVYYEVVAENYRSMYGKYRLTINRVAQDIVVTPYNGIYDGQAHSIIEEVTGEFGTMWYSLDKVNYVSECPTCLMPGDYTVYWYCVGDTNHYDEGTADHPHEVSAHIEKMDVVYRIPNQELDLAEPEGKEIYIDSPSDGDIIRVVAYPNVDVKLEGRYLKLVPVEEGSSLIAIYQAESAIYKAATFIFEVNVIDTAIDFTVESVTVVYSGSPVTEYHITITKPDPSECTIEFATTPDGPYYAVPDFYEDAGEYTVYFKISAPGRTTVYGQYDLSIAKAPNWAYVEGVTVTYDKEIHDLAVPTPGYHGTIMYSLDMRSWRSTIPSAIYPADFTVYWYCDGGNNYEDVGSKEHPYSVTSAILYAQIEYVARDITQPYTGQSVTTYDITITKPAAGDYILSFGRSAIGPWTAQVPAYKNTGEYTIYFRITALGYETVYDSYKLTIAELQFVYTKRDVEVQYTGQVIYDYDITVTPPPQIYTLTFADNPDGPWMPSPGFFRYKEVGIYTIYFRLQATGYKTVYDSYQLKIAAYQFVYTKTDVTAQYTGSPIIVTSNVVVTKPSTYTIDYSDDAYGSWWPYPSWYTQIGTYTVYFRLRADGYETVIDSYTLQIVGGSIAYTKNNVTAQYTGDYITTTDITVTSPSTYTITYSTSYNGPWQSTPSFYKNVSSYQIFFRIQADGYTTVVDFYTLTITKATPTATVVPETDLEYNGSYQGLIKSVTSTTGTVVYLSMDKVTWTSYYLTLREMIPNDYTVYWYCDGGNNYTDIGSKTSPMSVTVTIDKATITSEIEEISVQEGKTFNYSLSSLSNGTFNTPTTSDATVATASISANRVVTFNGIKQGEATILIRQNEGTYYYGHVFRFAVTVTERPVTQNGKFFTVMKNAGASVTSYYGAVNSYGYMSSMSLNFPIYSSDSNKYFLCNDIYLGKVIDDGNIAALNGAEFYFDAYFKQSPSNFGVIMRFDTSRNGILYDSTNHIITVGLRDPNGNLYNSSTKAALLNSFVTNIDLRDNLGMIGFGVLDGMLTLCYLGRFSSTADAQSHEYDLRVCDP